MSDGQDFSDWANHISRLDEIAKNARSTWFSLLVAILFCFITVLSIKDYDLFTNNLSLKLPLVDVSIDAVKFLVISPLIISVLFIYLQALLLKYVSYFSEIPWVLNDKATGRTDVPAIRFVSPWLVSDALTLWRLGPKQRRDWSEYASAVATCILGWLMAPGLILITWYALLPMHSFYLGTYVAFLFFIVLLLGINTIIRSISIVDRPAGIDGYKVNHSLNSVLYLTVILTIFYITLYTYSATKGIHLFRGDVLRVADYSPGRGLQIPAEEFVISPTRAKLAGARLSDRPVGWTPYEISSKGFFTINPRERLKNNYQILLLRSQQIGSVRGADLTGANLENADLSRTFAVNANLFGSSFRGASLFRTDMEGATSCDPFANTTFASKKCSVDFEGATLDGTRLTLSNLINANFRSSRLRLVRFLGATLYEADFSNALFLGTPFYFVDARKTVFDGVNARSVFFRWSLLQGANLSNMSPGPTNSTLRDDIGDSSTLLPEGVSIPTCFLENDDLRKGSLAAIPHLSDQSAEEYFCRSAQSLCFAGKWPGKDGFECCPDDEEPDAVCKQVLESWSSLIKKINSAPPR